MFAFISAYNRRKLYRAYPHLRHFDEAKRQARRAHKPVRYIEQAQRDAVTALLREGK